MPPSMITLLHLLTVVFCVSFMLMNGVRTYAEDGVVFNRPADAESRSRVLRASTLLVDHVVRGKPSKDPGRGEISVVAWHDPTLATTGQPANELHFR